nr:YhfC family glutamic-type intramembrane protease [uncultured Caproiciproducens sp.]
MVSGWSIAAMLFTMIVPLGVLIYLLVRFLVHYKTGIKPILIGAGVFLIFVLLQEQLLHRFILQWNPVTAAFFINPLAYAVYGALAAGIFEEKGRLVGFRPFFKQAKNWNHGVAYGIGHGGLEVIYLGGVLALTQINNIALSFMINNGTFGQLLKAAADTPSKASELETVHQQLIIQLSLSLLVLYAVARHRYLFYLLAILAHALVDILILLSRKKFDNPDGAMIEPQ